MDRLKVRTLFDEVYKATVHVIYKQDRGKTIQWLKRRFKEPMGGLGNFDDWFEGEGGCAHAFKYLSPELKEKHFFVWLPLEITTGTLVHECFHLCDMILDSRGVLTYPNDNNEHFAYYIDYWTRKIVNYCYKFDGK
jgi:hypothetical protein